VDRGAQLKILLSLLINLSRDLHELHSAWLLSFHYTTTINGDVVFFVSDHRTPPKQMSSEFVIKSTALEESVDDETRQDYRKKTMTDTEVMETVKMEWK
jgi:hypothetical protein